MNRWNKLASYGAQIRKQANNVLGDVNPAAVKAPGVPPANGLGTPTLGQPKGKGVGNMAAAAKPGASSVPMGAAAKSPLQTAAAKAPVGPGA